MAFVPCLSSSLIYSYFNSSNLEVTNVWEIHISDPIFIPYISWFALVYVILLTVITTLGSFMVKWVHLKTKSCVSGIGYKYSLFTGKTETISVQWKHIYIFINIYICTFYILYLYLFTYIYKYIYILLFLYSAFPLKEGSDTLHYQVQWLQSHITSSLFALWSQITLGMWEGLKCMQK